MSTYFSKVIKAGNKLREFNFRQVADGADARYSVDVPDDKGNRISFSMYKDAYGAWKTSAQLLPLWVHDSETLLGEAIEENKMMDMEKKSK